MADLRIAIAGAAGRMGQTLARLVDQTSGCIVAGATEAEGHPSLGEDVGVLTGLGRRDVALSDDPATAFQNVDAVIDFTTPAATLRHAEITAARNLVHVIGTTGLSEHDEQAITDAAKGATIIKAGNMSLGVNLLTQLTRQVAAALDLDFVRHGADARRSRRRRAGRDSR